MRIKKVDIYNYGKWEQKCFDLTEDLTIFLGRNEAGKSTLMAFIIDMLFDFPRKNEQIYVPFKGNQYGGRIFLEDTPYGDVIIERQRLKTKTKTLITNAQGDFLTEKELDIILANISKAYYLETFSFSLKDLEKVKQIREGDLNRYFLSIGKSGSEKILDITDDFLKESDKVFSAKANKKPLNMALTTLEKQALKLREFKENETLYRTLLFQQQELKEMLIKASEATRKAEETKNETALLLNLFPAAKALRNLKAEVEKSSQVDFPSAAASQIEYLEKCLQEGELRRVKLLTEIETQAVVPENHELKWYLEHQAQLDALYQDREILQQGSLQENDLTKQIEQLKAEVRVECAKLRLPETEALPKDLEPAEKQILQNFTQAKAKLLHQLTVSESEMGVYQKQLLDNEASQNEKQQQFAANQVLFQSEEKELETSSEKQESTLKQGLWLGLGAFFAVIGLVFYALYPENLWFWKTSFVLGGLSLIIFLYCKRRGKKTAPQLGQVAELQHQEQEQSRLLEESLAALKEQNQSLKTQLQQQQEILRKNQEALEQNQAECQNFMEKMGYFGLNIDAEQLLKADPFSYLRYAREKLKHLQQNLEQIKAQNAMWLEQANFFFEHSGDLNEPDARLKLKKLAAYYEEIRKAEEEAKQRKQFIQVKRLDLTKLEQQMQDYQAELAVFFKLSQTADITSLKICLKASEEVAKKKQEIQLLEQQVGASEEILQKFATDLELQMSLNQQTELALARREEERALEKEVAAVNQQIKFYEEDQQYESAQVRYEEQLNEVRQQAIVWGGYILAKKLLEEILQLGKGAKLPEIIEDCAQNFKMLTDGQYINVLLGAEELVVIRQDERNISLEQLSRGTLEQLYVALRFAFVKNVRSIAPLPILIDDGFVNFDQQRKLNMFKLLQEMSAYTQVIFFSFDADVKEIFSNAQITDLEK